MKPVYISYSSTDRDFAVRLVDALKKAGLSVWVDYLSMRPGKDWAEAIVTGITQAGALIVCLSPRSIESDWVRREINLARERNLNIIPIMIEASWQQLAEYPETRWIRENRIYVINVYERPLEEALPTLIEELQKILLGTQESTLLVATENEKKAVASEITSAQASVVKASSAQKNAEPECIKPIRIFISSPGDLFPEREVIKQVVSDLNMSPYYMNSYKLIPYAYEDTVPAKAGEEAQRVVDRYLIRPEAVDIFICMLWKRMGTPTKKIINPATGDPYQSGTEYEFLTAYEASQKSTENKPIILLYRCSRTGKDILSLDTEQFEKVKKFFARFENGDLDGLFRKFKSKGEFENIIQKDLTAILQRDF